MKIHFVLLKIFHKILPHSYTCRRYRCIHDNFIQMWNNKLNDPSRAATYILFATFEFSKKLDIILDAKY